MKVAWHEVPGKPAVTVPSRRERYDLWLASDAFHIARRFHVVNQDNTLQVFPGTSCQAIFLQSLRDN